MSIILTSLTLFGAACQTGAQTAAIAASPSTRFTTAQLDQSPPVVAPVPRRVALKVRRDLAQRFNLPESSLKIVRSSREIWSDSCLGLAAPNERCAMATVEGWRIEITNGQQTWAYPPI